MPEVGQISMYIYMGTVNSLNLENPLETFFCEKKTTSYRIIYLKTAILGKIRNLSARYIGKTIHAIE